MTRFCSDENGSVMLETSMSLGAILLLFFLACSSLYVVFAKATLNYYGYQSLICVAEGQRASICKNRIRTKIRRALPYGRINKFHLRGRRFRFGVHLRWSLAAQALGPIGFRSLSYRKTLKYHRGY